MNRTPTPVITTHVTAGPDNLTPAMRQYKAFKAKYPDAILFFRMGDFYELFWDDAKTAAKVLGLALTSRSKGPEAIPMAGVPFHAVESYLAKMIRAGHRVAICEQMEDPALAKGLIKRDVVRLMTPGTLTDESILSEREANYLAAVLPGRTSNEPAGLAWVELSTGQFFASGVADAELLMDELCRIRPAEVLLPDAGIAADSPERKLGEAINQLCGAAITRRPPWAFERHAAVGKLTEHFGTTTLAGFGFDGEPAELLAAGAILDYLQETQKTTVSHIRRLTSHRGSQFLQVDATTLRALEVLANMRDGGRPGSLLGAVDQTVTAMGSRRLRQWLVYPLRDLGQIEARQDAIAWLLDRPEKLKTLRTFLDAVCDVERVVSRLAVNRAAPRDLLGLARSLRQLPGIEGVIGAVGIAASAKTQAEEESNLVDPAPAWLLEVSKGFTNLDDLADYIERAISPDAPAAVRDGGVIRDGFDAELDELRKLAGGNRDWLGEYQAQLVRQSGISTLRVGYNQVFGYYIVSYQEYERILKAGGIEW
ncbi:MAG: DNA mismatch repair protein MutS [Phycisphaerae bacterium]|nr:DNA mismatch repair protein MutS [Phycisphaerae bacterium]